MNYSKVTKCQPKKSRPAASSQDDLARKDGLDKNSIIGSKRRRTEKSYDEDGQSLFKSEYSKVERSSSSEVEPEPKRKKLVHVEEEPKVEIKSPKEQKFKSVLPPGLKGTMNREAESKYNSMIASLFGGSGRY